MGANVYETVERIVKGTFGNGFAKGLMTSFDEIGINVVNQSETKAAKDLIDSLRKNGAKFNEKDLSGYMENNLTHGREKVASNIENFITDETKASSVEASQSAIDAFKKDGERLEKFLSTGPNEDVAQAAAVYFGKPEGSELGIGKLAKGYFGDPVNGNMRMGVTGGAAVATVAGIAATKDDRMHMRRVSGRPF